MHLLYRGVKFTRQALHYCCLCGAALIHTYLALYYSSTSYKTSLIYLHTQLLLINPSEPSRKRQKKDGNILRACKEIYGWKTIEDEYDSEMLL